MSSTNKFAELYKYILTKKDYLKLNKEAFDSWIEDGKAEFGGRKETTAGWQILSWHYTGVITVERINQELVIYLLLFVTTWLMDNDNTRENFKLSQPNVEFFRINDTLFDMEISIPFVDNIYLSQDDDGPIDWIDMKWKIDGYTFDIATSFELMDAIKKVARE